MTRQAFVTAVLLAPLVGCGTGPDRQDAVSVGPWEWSMSPDGGMTGVQKAVARGMGVPGTAVSRLPQLAPPPGYRIVKRVYAVDGDDCRVTTTVAGCGSSLQEEQ